MYTCICKNIKIQIKSKAAMQSHNTPANRSISSQQDPASPRSKSVSSKKSTNKNYSATTHKADPMITTLASLRKKKMIFLCFC